MTTSHFVIASKRVVILYTKFLDAGIQDVSMSISIVTIEQQLDGGDESDTHVEARDRRYSCLIYLKVQRIMK